MGIFSDINDPMADIYGQSETLGGVASYLPGQSDAFNRDVLTGILDNIIGSAVSNIGGTLGTAGQIEAGIKALSDLIGFDATQATPEQIQEALNNVNNPTAGLINSTVGSNQMLNDADLAAAQAAATEETVDLTEDTTANELLTIGSGDGSLGDSADLGTVSQDATVDQETVSDVNETWTYNKATDSFISSTRGDSIPNRGNAELKDGGVYAVTPVLGTDGVMAENVVDTETNESVGVFSIDINTGLPTITNKAAADKAAAAKAAAAKAAADKAAADKAAADKTAADKAATEEIKKTKLTTDNNVYKNTDIMKVSFEIAEVDKRMYNFIYLSTGYDDITWFYLNNSKVEPDKFYTKGTLDVDLSEINSIGYIKIELYNENTKIGDTVTVFKNS